MQSIAKKYKMCIRDRGEVIKGALSKGIDVSYHQGIIDGGKVKQTDIEFVLIRCGYGDDDIGQDDKYFKQNIQGCSENNIQYGIYIYSHAINTEMAKSEVNHVLRLDVYKRQVMYNGGSFFIEKFNKLILVKINQGIM